MTRKEKLYLKLAKLRELNTRIQATSKQVAAIQEKRGHTNQKKLNREKCLQERDRLNAQLQELRKRNHELNVMDRKRQDTLDQKMLTLTISEQNTVKSQNKMVVIHAQTLETILAEVLGRSASDAPATAPDEPRPEPR